MAKVIGDLADNSVKTCIQKNCQHVKCYKIGHD